MSKIDVSDSFVRFKGKEKAVAFITDDGRPFAFPSGQCHQLKD